MIKINCAQKYLRSFNVSVLNIKKVRVNLNNTSNPIEINDLKKDVSFRIDSCKEIQNEIKEIILSNEKFVNEAKNEEKYYSRIVANLYSACLKQFEKTAEKFNIEQNNVSDYLKQSILRDAEIYLEKKLTEDEKENILINPQVVQQLINSKLEGQAHTTMVNKVNELASRHQDILKLEKSVNEVYQLFVDLQVLVKQQGEIIDNIEANISTAKDCVIQGELDIGESYQNLKAARKKKCIVIIIIVVIIAVVVGTVVPFSL